MNGSSPKRKKTQQMIMIMIPIHGLGLFIADRDLRPKTRTKPKRLINPKPLSLPKEPQASLPNSNPKPLTDFGRGKFVFFVSPFILSSSKPYADPPGVRRGPPPHEGAAVVRSAAVLVPRQARNCNRR
jgi:hypothetical protein